MESVKVITLGCSKNTVDTGHLLACLEGRFEILPEDWSGPVDWLLINTCGFIGDAKDESIQVILEATGLKKEGLVGKLLVFGCLSQRYSSQMPSLIPEVDGWFGARGFEDILKAMGVPSGCVPSTPRYTGGDTLPYAYLKISEGCDRRCSYCAIPLIRGAHRSVDPDTLCREAEYLASRGVRELELIAQDTTYYGLDLYRKRSLGALLQDLSSVDGIERLRIHYSYPADFPDDVLEQMALNPKVCKYLDIPLQHVSDKVLTAMRRGVDGRFTREFVSRVRSAVPGVVLRTTMMVGHPGEGTREFEELLDFVSRARFERLGAFCYSEEEGTFGAENFKDSVRKSTKEKRLDRLMELQSGISFAYNLSRVGTEVKVLVDGVTDNGLLVCRSESESPEVDGEILVPSEEDLSGQFVTVRITGADEYDLTGTLLTK